MSDLDKTAARRGHMVTLIGEGITVDELAHHIGTIGYEVLTSLGRRYARIYKGGEVKAKDDTAGTVDIAVSGDNNVWGTHMSGSVRVALPKEA